MTDSAFVGNDLLDGKQPQNMTGARIPLGGTGGALPISDDDGLPPGLKEDYTQAQRGTFKHLLDVDAQTEARMERDRARIEHQYEAEGVGPGEFQKWDAGAESKKYQTDPIQAFGSLGSVFGMLASAFTRAPMENALNASAAAMNAVRAGDEEAYNRAHDAWKENTDLTFKRHQLEHERLGDALRLMDTDMAAGAAKARMVAAQFGMNKEMVLLNAGMMPELYEAMEKRADAINKTGQAVQEIQGRGFQFQVFKRDSEMIDKNIQDPTEKGRALLDAFNNAFFLHMKPGDPRAQALGQFAAETIKGKGRLPTADELIAKNKEITEALTRPLVGPGGRPSLQGEHAQTLEGIKQDLRANHPDWTEGQIGKQAEKEFRESQAVMTGNRADDIVRLVNQQTLAMKEIDGLEKMLAEHNAIAGVGGKVRRTGESVIEAFGGSADAAKMFAGRLTRLRQIVSQIIDNKTASGRGLSVTEQRVDAMAPGIEVGSGAAFAVDMLRDLQRVIREEQQFNTNRLPGGKQQAPGAPGGKDEVPAWKRLGVPDKRSEAQPADAQKELRP
jgi:hypothetical protein